MYFPKTKSNRCTVAATLLALLSLSTSVIATDLDEATLTSSERAAQSAIAHSPIYSGDLRSETAHATLANNEDAARHAITPTPADNEFANLRIERDSSATSEPTLVHNELSAQHVIVDAQRPSSFPDVRRASAAINLSPSDRSVAPH